MLAIMVFGPAFILAVAGLVVSFFVVRTQRRSVPVSKRSQFLLWSLILGVVIAAAALFAPMGSGGSGSDYGAFAVIALIKGGLIGFSVALGALFMGFILPSSDDDETADPDPGQLPSAKVASGLKLLIGAIIATGLCYATLYFVKGDMEILAVLITGPALLVAFIVAITAILKIASGLGYRAGVQVLIALLFVLPYLLAAFNAIVNRPLISTSVAKYVLLGTGIVQLAIIVYFLFAATRALKAVRHSAESAG